MAVHEEQGLSLCAFLKRDENIPALMGAGAAAGAADGALAAFAAALSAFLEALLGRVGPLLGGAGI